MLTAVQAPPAGFDAHQRHDRIFQKAAENSHGVGAAAHAGIDPARAVFLRSSRIWLRAS